MKKLISFILALALCVSFATTFVSADKEDYVTDGLKAFYDGNIHSEDGKTWTDASGNGLDIDLSGVDSSIGYFEDGAFVSKSAKVFFPTEIAALISTGCFTTEMVIGDTEVLGTSFGTYINTSNDNYSLFIRCGDQNYAEFKCAGNARPKVEVDSKNFFKDSTVTVTYDKDGDVCLYANGELLMSVPCTAGAFNCTDFFFGYNAGNAREHNTEFKAMRFYDRALTADEVAANYAADCAEEAPSTDDPADDPAEPAEKGENIALGKSYTVTGVEKLRDDGWDDTVPGTKLTDGEKLRDKSASTVIYGINAKEAEIVIDLGEKTDIVAVSSDLFGGTWGITDPINAVAKFFISDDGETFTDYATVNGDEAESVLDVEDSWKIRVFEASKAASARYVKVQFIIPEGVPAFTWISEIEVFAPAEEAPVEESKEESKPAEESKQPTPKTGDAGMIALAVVSAIALAGVAVVKKSK